MKSKLKIMLVTISTCLCVDICAQEENPTVTRRGKLIQKRAETLAKKMELDKQEKEMFISLYTEFQDKLMTLRKAEMPNRNQKKDNKELTDEEAEKLIANRFETEQKTLDLKKEYYEKMKKHFKANQLIPVFSNPLIGMDRRPIRMPRNDAMRPRNGGWGGPEGPDMEF